MGTWARALSAIGVQMYLQTRDKGKRHCSHRIGEHFGNPPGGHVFGDRVACVLHVGVPPGGSEKWIAFFIFGVFMGTDVAARVHVMALAAVRRL